MSALLEVSGLAKSYGGIRAVIDVSFAVQRGEMLALIGPNGAGKTTCFNMLMGQIAIDRGEVVFNGRRLNGLPPRRIWRLGVGRTFQITQTYATMTVIENVQMVLASYHRRVWSLVPYARRLYVDEAMALLELVAMSGQAQRPAAVLAYGDLKRLELAIALAHKPDLLLMDEPTAGMAPGERVALMQLTSDIVKQRQISALFTEHDMDVVFTHADRILVLNRGELIANGTGEQVRGDERVREVYLGGGSTYGEAG